MVIMASTYYLFNNELRGDYIEWIVNDPNVIDSLVINKISMHDTFNKLRREIHNAN